MRVLIQNSRKRNQNIYWNIRFLIYSKKIAYVCSFGTESAIILHLISKINKELPIIILNTRFLFKETISYKNQLIKLLGLKNCNEVFPDEGDLNKFDRNNNLWKSEVDRCCNIRKIVPLEKSLKGYNAWISGRKSYHLGERQHLKAFELINKKTVINPLFNATREFIEEYFSSNKLPKHPLFKKGYLSIGCTHCTIKTNNFNNPRQGRWSETFKDRMWYSLYKKIRIKIGKSS